MVGGLTIKWSKQIFTIMKIMNILIVRVEI